MSGEKCHTYEFKIVEYHDDFGNIKSWLCQVRFGGEPIGVHFEAKTHEQVFAWLQVVMGSYPGTGFNGPVEAVA